MSPDAVGEIPSVRKEQLGPKLPKLQAFAVLLLIRPDNQERGHGRPRLDPQGVRARLVARGQHRMELGSHGVVVHAGEALRTVIEERMIEDAGQGHEDTRKPGDLAYLAEAGRQANHVVQVARRRSGK